MAVFNSFQSARDALVAAGFKSRNKGETIDAYLDDYANIAFLLCDLPRFETYLRHTSANLWNLYLRLPADAGNRFTRAMGSMARDMGFTFQEHLKVETPPISIVLISGDDPKFGQYVRSKIFWKDGMDSRHGEHSHSLQWLTIAYAEVTAHSAAELYSKTVDFSCTNQDGNVVYLWSWLVDCFPGDMKKFASKVPGGDTLESDSFRAPQHLMDYLLMGPVDKLEDHFVAQYLFYRYKKRKWLTLGKDEYYQPDKVVTDIQPMGIQQHGRDKHKNDEWTANYRPGQKGQDGGIRSFQRAADGGKVAKQSQEATYHGKTGPIYYGFS